MRLVEELTYRRLLGRVLQLVPTRFFRNPENVGRRILIAVFRVGVFGVLGRLQLLVLGLKGVGDVFQEDQPENYMLVLGGVHVPAELVSSTPQLILKTKIGTVSFLVRHVSPLSLLAQRAARSVRAIT